MPDRELRISRFHIRGNELFSAMNKRVPRGTLLIIVF